MPNTVPDPIDGPVSGTTPDVTARMVAGGEAVNTSLPGGATGTSASGTAGPAPTATPATDAGAQSSPNPANPITVRDTTPDTTIKAALLFLCFVAGAWALYHTAELLAPFALAVFFWLVIDAFARWLDDRADWLHYRVSLSFAILVVVAAIAGLIYVIADTATDIAAQSDLYTRRLSEMALWVGEATGLDLSRNALRQTFDVGRLVRSGLGGFATTMQAFVADTFLITIYVAFLFVAQKNFSTKLDDMIPDADSRRRTRMAWARIRHSIESYLSVQTIISLIQTVLSFAILVAFGMDNALFWALVIFILNYIPIVGAIGAALLPALFALVQFDSLATVVALGGLLTVVQTLIANTLQPKMMGDSLNLSALVVVVALVVWGALWGGVGAFLSAPLTVIIMVILAQFPATHWLAVVLSADGQPDLDPYTKKRNQAIPGM